MRLHPGLRILSSAVLAWAAAACGRSGDVAGADAVAVSLSDSAGVTMVLDPRHENPRTAVLEPVWRHGHGADHYAFRFIGQATLRSDGSAVVAEGGSDEVIAIHPSGEQHTILARSGQGPGEVQGPRSVVGVPPDTVWVEDTGNARLLLFVGDSLASSVNTREIPDVSLALMPLGTAPDGRLLMRTSRFRPEFDEPWFRGALAVFDPLSGTADTVGSHPLAHQGHHPTLQDPFFHQGPITAAGGRFAYGQTDAARITWQDANGTITRIGEWEPVLTYPSDSLWNAFTGITAQELRRLNPGITADRIAERIGSYSMDPAAPLPLFGPLQGAPDGSVWVADYSPLGRGVPRYRVMGADGGWSGVVEFPEPFQVLSVLDDRVLGVVTDEFDVQALAVYRFRWP